MDVLVLADTHIRRGSSRTLPPRVRQLAAHADVILHAGDIVVAEVLEELAAHAPVHAVLGNNDHELIGVLPETLQVELAGVRVAMVLDSGAARGREARLARRFPGCDLVVFGHSHIRGTRSDRPGRSCSIPVRRPSAAGSRTAPPALSDWRPDGSSRAGSKSSIREPHTKQDRRLQALATACDRTASTSPR